MLNKIKGHAAINQGGCPSIVGNFSKHSRQFPRIVGNFCRCVPSVDSFRPESLCGKFESLGFGDAMFTRVKEWGNSAAVSPSQANFPTTMTHHRCKASYLRGVLSLLRHKPIRIRKRPSRGLAAEFDSDCPIGKLLSKTNCVRRSNWRRASGPHLPSYSTLGPTIWCSSH